MVTISKDEMGCAMTSMAIQNYSIDELLNVVQKFKAEELHLPKADTETLKMFQDNCKNCHRVVAEFLSEKINEDNRLILDFGDYQMEIYSNKQRLNIVNEAIEGIILTVEKILTERGI
jgi:hypothetical protein